MISQPIRSDAFVGRSEEIAFLDARLQQAASGASSLVLLRGERGVGKTRLLAELRVRHSSLRYTYVRFPEAHSAPGAALRELYDALAGVSNTGSSGRWSVSRLLKELRVAIAARKHTPAVVILDDAHHADSASLEVLEKLDGVAGVVCIAAFVPEALNSAMEEAILRAHSRGSYDLTLVPLTSDAMRAMIKPLRVNGRRLAEAIVQQIVELSAGNPAFAREMIRLTLEPTQGAAKNIVPEIVGSRCRRMLESLEPQARRLTMIAAITGSSFTVELLASLAKCDEMVVIDALQQAVSAGLVQELTRGEFEFRYPLLREGVRAEATPSWAAQYHREIACRREEIAASTDDLEALVAHWLAAGDMDRTLHWCERAGDQLVDERVYARAADFYGRASGVVPLGDKRRAPFLLKFANALRRAGLEDEAMRAFERLLECEGEICDAESKAKALLDKMLLSWGAGSVDEANAIGREILALDLPLTSSVKPLTMVKLAGFRALNGSFDEALAMLEELEERFPLADAQVLAQFHQQRAIATLGSRSFDDAIEDFQHGIRYAEHAKNVPLLAQHLCNFGNLALHCGHTQVALQTLERAYGVAQQAASASKLYLAVASYAHALIRVGRLQEARAVVDVTETHSHDFESLHAYYMVVPMLELGSMLDDPALIERALEGRALDVVFRSGESQRIVPIASGLAAHYWYTGDAESARELLHRTLISVDQIQWNFWFSVLVAKFGASGDAPRARRLLEKERERSDVRVADAFLDLFDAFVGRRRGRSSAAAAAGARAARAFARIGWPFFEAQAYEAAGTHARALETYERIGDVRDARILRAAIRPSRHAAGYAVALTDREREIAALASTGLTSKEIAKSLQIGTRTVEHHLQVVYGKLGIRSRWQIPLELSGSQ